MSVMQSKIKEQKKIREDHLQELTVHVKNIKATDVITTGDFDKDACPQKCKNL